MGASGKTAGLRVVAVDDERIAREGVMLQLSRISCVQCARAFAAAEDVLAYLEANDADVALVDISMRGMDGLTLAECIQRIHPQCAIIFLTGYAEYAVDAFRLKAFGYLLKPACEEDIERELRTLVERRFAGVEDKLRIQTFGDFEAFIGNEPVRFPRRKSKEAFAYLVDRRGSGVTAAQLATVIWENKEYSRSIQKQVQTVLSDMSKALGSAGVAHAVVRSRNRIAVDVSQVECDYYRFLAGDPEALRQFTGEYMAGYSWAEGTVGELSRLSRNG